LVTHINLNAMKTQNLTLEQIKNEIEIWITDTNFDLQQDWNEEKEKMFLQLQSLLSIKSNIENIENLGGQIFRSTITRK
jgi:hypothetical protein